MPPAMLEHHHCPVGVADWSSVCAAAHYRGGSITGPGVMRSCADRTPEAPPVLTARIFIKPLKSGLQGQACPAIRESATIGQAIKRANVVQV